MADQLPSAIDPITGEDWTVLQFLQAIRLDLSLLTGIDGGPGNPDGTGNELLEGNLCPNSIFADNTDGWMLLEGEYLERHEINDHVAADHEIRVGFTDGVAAPGYYFNALAMVDMPAVSVTPGDQMVVSVDHHGINGGNVSRSGSLIVRFFANGQFVQEAEYDATITMKAFPSRWDRTARLFTVPEGVDEMRPRIRASYTSTSGGGGDLRLTAASYVVGDGGINFPEPPDPPIA